MLKLLVLTLDVRLCKLCKGVADCRCKLSTEVAGDCRGISEHLESLDVDIDRLMISTCGLFSAFCSFACSCTILFFQHIFIRLKLDDLISESWLLFSWLSISWLSLGINVYCCLQTKLTICKKINIHQPRRTSAGSCLTWKPLECDDWICMKNSVVWSSDMTGMK